ncbi:tetratricopeptide repeat protein [Sphingopyxis sp. NJF-3]
MDRTKDSGTSESGDTDRIIADELEQLLASPLFVRSPVLSRLLQFLAEHRLQGGRSAPKAYAIATEALGRSADFDPAVDSYPRVMVGRLRSLLDRYYVDTPWIHRLRVPQGSYEIVVQYRASPPSRPGDASAAGEEPAIEQPAVRSPDGDRRTSPRWWWAAIAAAALIALFAAWWTFGDKGHLLGKAPAPVPLLEVSAPVAGETPESRAMARALDGKLRDGLRRFELVDLLSARAPDARAAGRAADYRLDTSIVRTAEGPVDVTLVLNRVADQRAIWSDQIRVAADQLPEFGAIAPSIAQIAGDYGVIVRDQVQREPDNFAAGFPCLAQFNRMRQMRNATTVRQVDRCLRASLAESPRDPVLLNALSLLRFGDWQPQRSSAAGKAALAEARQLAERAYESAPASSAGLFAMARAHFYAGNCAAGTPMGDAAVALNPYDPDLAGFLGLFKASCGDLAGGEPLLRRSIELDSTYAGVPAVTLAFMLSQRGETDEALAILDRMPSPSNLEPQYLMVRAIVLARRGDVAGGRRLWGQLLDYTGQPAGTPPEKVLRQFMITPAVIARSAATLRNSGVVAAKPAG